MLSKFFRTLFSFKLSSLLTQVYLRGYIFRRHCIHGTKILPSFFIIYGLYKRKSIFCLDEKVYLRSEISKHDNHVDGIWVTYLGKVYDITEFVESHPGGKIIMQAAGKDLTIFFDKFPFHKTNTILELMEPYFIGMVQEDIVKDESEINDEFADDPKRDPRLIVHSERPFNSETPANLIDQDFYTQTEIFFVRNHMPVPNIDSQSYQLKFCIQLDLLNNIPTDNSFYYTEKFELLPGQFHDCLCRDFTYDYLLSKVPQSTINSTIQCSGNRRKEMNDVKPVQGLEWEGGAIGNAFWHGFLLKDLFKDFHASSDLINNNFISHVRLTGGDSNSAHENYEVSIPLAIALSTPTLIAYKMNGEYLSRDHGFPLRVVAPGITGARNVKWLAKIVIATKESQTRWQQEDYRCYSPDKKLGQKITIDVPAIQEMPVSSFICSHKDGQTVQISQGETIKLHGWAYSGGGKSIGRVEVSTDNGETWHPCNLLTPPIEASFDKHYCWNQWNISLPIDKTDREISIICKAVDSAYNNQPESASPIWNMRGLLNNSWHKINIKISSK